MNFVRRIREIARTSDPDACWDWPGFCVDGYGKAGANIDARGHRVWFAHRAAYTVLIGPVPAELELDHLCRNRRCMNPRHMEPVTPRENALRSLSPIAANASKTNCKHGHPFTPENTYVSTTRYGTTVRACRACAIAWGKAQGVRRRQHQRGTRPTCRHGHALTPENIVPQHPERRRCLTCHRERDARQHREKRARLRSA